MSVSHEAVGEIAGEAMEEDFDVLLVPQPIEPSLALAHDPA